MKQGKTLIELLDLLDEIEAEETEATIEARRIVEKLEQLELRRE